MTNSHQDKSALYPAALTVAGSDSGGGAGIEADLRTFNAFAVFGCCAITALTAQNPSGVRRIDPVPAEGVAAQMAAVLDAFPVRYCKTGMLFSREIVHAVAVEAKKYALKLIIDPVMVATSGARLLEDDAVSALREELLPLAAWITPNVPEAELLLQRKLCSGDDLDEAAQELAGRTGAGVVLKGGHISGGQSATDRVAFGGEVWHLSSPRLDDCRHSHGTGCTFSAALTANLALGMKAREALIEAKTFVFGSLVEPVEIAQGVKAMYPPEEDYSGYIEYRKAVRA